MSSSRTDRFGILAIVIAIVVSTWAFGFADNIFSTVQTGFDEIDDNLISENYFIPKTTPVVDSMIKENTIPVSTPSILNESTMITPKEKTELSESSSPKSEKSVSQSYDEIDQIVREESLEDKVKRLEEQTFILSGDGSGYEGAVNLSKYARLKFELNPVLGTELDEFDIKRGTLNLGGYIFVIGGGTVILEQDIISIHVEHDDHRDPYLDITGTVNGSLLNGEHLNISFENQLLGLTQDDQTPIHLSLELTMDIQN